MGYFGGFSRNVTAQRVNTATTTVIAAGAQAVGVTVVAASSSSSPTIMGAAMPAGYSVNYNALDTETLNAVTIVTLSGDDVLITTIR